MGAKAINWFRGDTYPFVVTVKDKATGLPIDLTGATLHLSVNRKQNPANTSTELFKIAGVVDASPATGKVTFTPTSVGTDQTGTFYYDIQMVTGSGPGTRTRTIVKDEFIISQDLTK